MGRQIPEGLEASHGAADGGLGTRGGAGGVSPRSGGCRKEVGWPEGVSHHLTAESDTT